MLISQKNPKITKQHLPFDSFHVPPPFNTCHQTVSTLRHESPLFNVQYRIKHLDPTNATEAKRTVLHPQSAAESFTGSLGPACPVKIFITLNLAL